MRICYISNVDVSIPNGPGVNELEFMLAIKKELDRHVVFIMPQPASSSNLNIEDVHYYRSFRSAYRIDYYLRLVLVSLAQIIAFHRVSRQNKFDLIVFRMDYSCVISALYFKLRRYPYTIKTLGNKGRKKDETDTGFWKVIRRRILGHLFEKSVRWAIGVDVCTAQYERFYSSWVPKSRIRVVENVVNTEKFHPMEKGDVRQKLNLEQYEKIVGYIGGSPSERGARQLVEVSPELIRHYPECGILIVGEDNGLFDLKERIKQLGTERNFVWCGTVPYNQAPYYINCFDVGIGLDTYERVERIGNASQKIRQYLACGVPVICPKKTNLFVERDDLGCLVDGQNLGEIFSAIDGYFQFSEEEKKQFSDRAVKYVKNNLSTTVAVKARMDFWKTILYRRL